MLIKMTKILLGLSLIVLFVNSSVMAQDMGKEVELKPNQTKCPVMGGEISKEVFTDHNGKRVYFCCPGCDATFKQDPEKYLEKMEKEGVVLEDAPIEQTACPVSGKPINEEVYTDHDGKRVYFCCGGCKKSFIESPGKYSSKL